MNRRALGFEIRKPAPGKRVVFGLIVVTVATAPIAVALRASADGPPPPSSQDRSIIEAIVAHSFHEAHAQAKRLAQAEPENARSLALLGLTQLKMGQYQAAEASLQRSLALEAACPEAHLGIGHLAFGRNDLEAAARHFERAVASRDLYDEAYRALRVSYLDHGDLAGARRTVRAHQARLTAEKRSIDARVAGIRAFLDLVDRERVLRIPAGFEGTSVEMVDREGAGATKMIRIRLNDRGEYLFHIDSAFRGMLALSPQLADELELQRAGESESRGVGPESLRTFGAWLDTIRIGDLTVEDVPVQVIDVATYRGKKRGLVGAGLLKQFNVTIDVRKGVLELFPRHRAAEFRRRIAPERVAQTVPFLIYPAPIVLVRVADGRPLPFTVDTAASSSLIDEAYFNTQLRPAIPEEELAISMTTGSGGTRSLECWTAAKLGIGELVFSDMRVISFAMPRLNVLAGRYAAGVLSNHFFRRYRAHFDFSRTELILEAWE